MADRVEDYRAIEAIVRRQFASLSWPDGAAPDIGRFVADFLPEAQLFAAARPAKAQSVHAFGERMRGLAGGALRSFDETVLWCRISVYGKVANATVACETLENGTETNRNVEMMLLVKDAEGWKIAAQAWDKEDPVEPAADDLPAVRL